MGDLRNEEKVESKELAKKLLIFLIVFLLIKKTGLFEKHVILQGTFLKEFFSILLSLIIALYDQALKLPQRLWKIIISHREIFFESKRLKKVLKNYNFIRIYEIKEDKEAEKLLYDAWNKHFSRASEVRISGIAQFENLGKDFWEYQKNKESDRYEGVLTKNFIANITTDIKILLLYPFESDSKARERIDKFIGDRIDEINEGKSEKDRISIEKYKENIVTTYKMIQELNKKRQKHKIQVVFYDHRPIFRSILFPDRIFFSPYLPGREGHETIIIECAKEKQSFYHSFSVLFDYYWDEYKDKFQENIICEKH